MPESQVKPTISGADGHVHIDLGGTYLDMDAETARKFGARIVAAANQAEGRHGYQVLFEIPDKADAAGRADR